jgi:3-methylfumaryl-CoA hydratase
MAEDLSSWVGRSRAQEDTVTPRIVAEYRATLAPYLFQPAREDECPPGLHWALAPAMPAADQTGEDGAEAKGLFLPPIALQRRMWAGGSIETLRPLRISETVRRVSRIAEVKEREGKSGPLCFVSVTHEILSGSEVAIRERQDLVFRSRSSVIPAQAGTQTPDLSGDLVWKVEATPLLLFRFSAFTFNGHRIHYDEPFAREVEGYPGLLVHGPLQAALLLNQLATLAGEVPPRMDYRCLAPLIAGRAFTVAAKGTTARIIDANGVVTCEGLIPPLPSRERWELNYRSTV